MRNRVERFFRYLKKKMRVRPYNTGSRTLKLFTLYYQAARTGRLSENTYHGTIWFRWCPNKALNTL
jgi:hypothetical protein